MTDKHTIVLFDGVCNLCNGFVNWLIDRDPDKKFRFASLQSEVAAKQLGSFGIDEKYLYSIVVVKNGRVYKNSRAVLEIARSLGGVYSLLYIFVILPPFIRDAMYKFVANNRYKWFGVSDTCRIPTDDIKGRFL
jgi:predicted DCC family thiol-disulfide oxidoreductase YuxK